MFTVMDIFGKKHHIVSVDVICTISETTIKDPMGEIDPKDGRVKNFNCFFISFINNEKIYVSNEVVDKMVKVENKEDINKKAEEQEKQDNQEVKSK